MMKKNICAAKELTFKMTQEIREMASYIKAIHTIVF